MSSTTSPVNGNQNFTQVITAAAQVPSLNITDVTAGIVTSNTVSCSLCFSNPLGSFQGKTLRSLRANVPTSSLPLVAATPYWLNANPGTASATTVAGGVLQLPAGATLVSAFYQDAAAATAVSFNIGTATISGGAATTSTNLFNTLLLAGAVAGAVVGVNSSVAPAAAGAFGAAGIATGGASIAVSSTIPTGISITPVGGNLTASSGSLTIFYLI